MQIQADFRPLLSHLFARLPKSMPLSISLWLMWSRPLTILWSFSSFSMNYWTVVPKWDNTSGADLLALSRKGAMTTLQLCWSLIAKPRSLPAWLLCGQKDAILHQSRGFALLSLNSMGFLLSHIRSFSRSLWTASASSAKLRWLSLPLIYYHLYMCWKCPLCHQPGDWWKYWTISTPVSFPGVLCSSLAARWPITTLIIILWPNGPANFWSS